MFNFVYQYRKYGDKLNSWDVVKSFALLVMIIDHVGSYLLTDNLWLRAIGRLSFPVWVFLAGYARPSRVVTGELVAVAALMVLSDYVFGRNILPLNILVTIIFCRMIIYYIDAINVGGSVIAFVVLLIAFTVLYPFTKVFFEYGSLAFLVALWGYYHRLGRRGLEIAMMVCCYFLYILFQQAGFRFDEDKASFIAVSVMLLFYALYKFSVVEMSSGVRLLDNVLRFLSRNTLYIYFIHVFIFSWLAWLMSDNPPQLFSFRLL